MSDSSSPPLTDYQQAVNDFIELLKALRAWRKVIHLQYQGRTIGRVTVNFAELMKKSSSPKITIVDHFDDDPNMMAWRKLHGSGPATLNAASADQPAETAVSAEAEASHAPPNLPPIGRSRFDGFEIPTLTDSNLTLGLAITRPILPPLDQAFVVPDFDEMLGKSLTSGILAIPRPHAAKTSPSAGGGVTSDSGPQLLDQHLPSHVQRSDDTGVDLTFGDTDDRVNSDQLVTQKLESTFSDILKDDSKISSVTVSATTNGHGKKPSDHVNGDAVDINVINGVHVAASGQGFKNAEDLENAAKKDDNVRYVEGPAGNFVRSTGSQNFTPSRGGLPGNDIHVHISVFPDK
jgi:hypothetical protein